MFWKRGNILDRGRQRKTETILRVIWKFPATSRWKRWYFSPCYWRYSGLSTTSYKYNINHSWLYLDKNRWGVETLPLHITRELMNERCFKRCDIFHMNGFYATHRQPMWWCCYCSKKQIACNEFLHFSLKKTEYSLSQKPLWNQKNLQE